MPVAWVTHVFPPDCTVSQPRSNKGIVPRTSILALEMQAARPIPTVMDTKMLDVHRTRGTRSNYIQGTSAVQPHQANHPPRARSPEKLTSEFRNKKNKYQVDSATSLIHSLAKFHYQPSPTTSPHLSQLVAVHIPRIPADEVHHNKRYRDTC